jgi:hypothetical protein
MRESDDSRVLWKIVSSLLGKNIANKPFELSKHNRLTSGIDAATEFSNYFFSVAECITSNLGPVNNDVAHDVPFCEASCFLFPTSELEMKNIFRLCQGKQLQIDDFQPRILSLVADTVAPVLAYIFNLCMSTGVNPDSLKRARVIPIF